jgi:hypothetical protein
MSIMFITIGGTYRPLPPGERPPRPLPGDLPPKPLPLIIFYLYIIDFRTLVLSCSVVQLLYRFGTSWMVGLGQLIGS